MSTGEATTQAAPARRSLRPVLVGLTLIAVLGLLFGVPWWALVVSGARWPTGIVVAGTIVFVGGLAAFPVLMYLGHGSRRLDWAARASDTILGVMWVMFVWALLGNVLRLALGIGGVADPARSRIVAVAVVAVAIVLLFWGYAEAMRVPRVKRVDVIIPRLGTGLDGLRVVLLTDTHYGPINRRAGRPRLSRPSTNSTPTLSVIPATSPTAACRNDGSGPRRWATSGPDSPGRT